MQETPDFSIVTSALVDETRPFPPKLLYHLSSLSPSEAIQLKHTWPEVRVERRRGILEDLEDLSEKDDLLIFDEIGKIGLKDPDPQVIINAIKLLWQTEDKKLVPVYLDLLAMHADESVRAAAGNILGNFVYLGEIESIPAALLKRIEEALLEANHNDHSDLVRRRTLESLGYSSRQEVEGLIKIAIKHKDTLWLESALFAMGRSADEMWDKDVLRMLHHEDPGVRISAIHAAGDLALDEARSYMMDLLEEEIEDDEMLSEVIWSLSQIGGHGARETLEGLQDKTTDEDILDLIEDALDNLSLTEDASLFELMDVDLEGDEDEEDILNLDEDLGDEEL